MAHRPIAPTRSERSERRRWVRVRPAALCALSGCLLFLSCADFDIWPLTWFAIVPLLAVAVDERCDRPFVYGWIAGLFANGGGFYWINGLLMRFGHMPFIAAAPIFLLLVGYQAITYGLFAWAVRHLRDGTRLPMVLLAPIAMTALELVVPFVFPWYLAITQAWQPAIIQIADITGPLGVTFLIVMVNGALYDALSPWLRLPRLFPSELPPESGARRVAWKPLLAALAVLALDLVYGQIRIHQVEAKRAAAPHVKVGVVQANIGINEKFVRSLEPHQLAMHQRLSADLAARGAQAIVWPESAYPYAIGRRQRTDFDAGDRRKVMRGFARPLLFGALTIGEDSPYPFNTALMMDARGNITGSFDKNFLLVFGEYIPYYEHLKWIRDVIPEAGNFARGESVSTFPLETAVGRFRLGPMICYEDIIPSFGRRLVAEHPNLLVNITNDAWFGATSEPYEHMALAVYRAVEHRLDLVRAVNTGVSAFIDATGRVRESGPAVDPVETPGVQPITLLADTAMLDGGGLYQSVGDLFGMLNLAALLVLGARVRKARGQPIAWTLVGVAGAALLALAGLSLLAASPASPSLALALLTHRPTASTAESLATGARLFAAAGAACVAVGFLMSRLARRMRLDRPPRVEGAIAAVSAFLLPPLIFGRIEGETASLVFTALGAVALLLLGLRLGARSRRTG